jgi:hypothetical protein
MSLLCNDGGAAYLYFGDVANNDVGQIVYDHSNNSLILVTNASERMRVNGSGNVGIGTNDPSDPLHVIGYIKSSIGFKAANYTTMLESGNESVFGNTAYYGVLFKTNNTTRMKITNAGLVGIGTASPASKLHVYGAGTVAQFEGTGGNVFIQFKDSDDGTLAFIGADGGDLKFQTPTGSYSDKLTIKNNGLVGIGTVTPSQKLHVVGKALITDDVQLTGSNPRIDFNTNGSSSLRFYDTTNAAERMRINTSGNLGINTTSPTSKLQVVGSTSGDSVLKVDGTNGTLFEVVDDLSDSLMSVNDAAGLPVFEVFADNHIVAGRYNQNDFYLNTNGNLGLGTASALL